MMKRSLRRAILYCYYYRDWTSACLFDSCQCIGYVPSFRASSTTWSWERWSASSPSDPYGLITAPLSLTRTSSFGATHHLEGEQSYPTLEIGIGIEKGACEESHAQTYTEEYFRIGSRANSDPCGDGAMEFSRTTCFMHANPK